MVARHASSAERLGVDCFGVCTYVCAASDFCSVCGLHMYVSVCVCVCVCVCFLQTGHTRSSSASSGPSRSQGGVRPPGSRREGEHFQDSYSVRFGFPLRDPIVRMLSYTHKHTYICVCACICFNRPFMCRLLCSHSHTLN